MKENCLYVIWKNPDTMKSYTIGRLTSNNGYQFEYIKDFNDARKNGMDFIQSFPVEKEYTSKVLFPVFSSRLPDRKRKDINMILKKYGLSEYDGFELLKKSGGKLPIDTYEFAAPN